MRNIFVTIGLILAFVFVILLNIWYVGWLRS